MLFWLDKKKIKIYPYFTRNIKCFFLQKKQQHCMENISYCSRWSKSFWKLYDEEKKTKPRTFNCCWRHEAITNCKQQQLQVFGANNRTKNNTCCQYYAYSTIFLQLFRFFLQILNALSMFFCLFCWILEKIWKNCLYKMLFLLAQFNEIQLRSCNSWLLGLPRPLEQLQQFLYLLEQQ